MHTYVKSKLKWSNRHDFFSILFIENDLYIENVNMGVSVNEPNGRMVQPTQLILITIEAEFCALLDFRKFFFRISF